MLKAKKLSHQENHGEPSMKDNQFSLSPSFVVVNGKGTSRGHDLFSILVVNVKMLI